MKVTVYLLLYLTSLSFLIVSVMKHPRRARLWSGDRLFTVILSGLATGLTFGLLIGG